MTIEASLARFDTSRPTRNMRPSLARRLELRARRRRTAAADRVPVRIA